MLDPTTVGIFFYVWKLAVSIKLNYALRCFDSVVDILTCYIGEIINTPRFPTNALLNIVYSYSIYHEVKFFRSIDI